jgi:hypothetical protein
MDRGGSVELCLGARRLRCADGGGKIGCGEERLSPFPNLAAAAS